MKSLLRTTLVAGALLAGAGCGVPASDCGAPCATPESGGTDAGGFDATLPGSDAAEPPPPEVCDGVDNDGDAVIDLAGCHPDLIAWYRFEPWGLSAGDPAWDSSGNGHHGTLAGDGYTFPKSGPGYPNQGSLLAAHVGIFNSGYGSVDVPASSELSPTSGLTVELWALVESPFLLRREGAYRFEWIEPTPVTDERVLEFAVSEDGMNEGMVASTSWFWEFGFHHYAVSFDPLAGTAAMYIDGLEVAVMLAGAATSLYDGGDVTFGISGALDEVKFWSAVRTEAEICSDAGGTYTRGAPNDCLLPTK